MREQGHGIHQIHDPELTNCRVGLFAGHVVSIVGDWQDGQREMHYRVRLANGEINPDVHQDEISFDPALIHSKSC